MEICPHCKQRIVNPVDHYDGKCVRPVADSESVANRKIETREETWEAN